MACADVGLVYEHLSWTSWTATKATAVGTMAYKVCQPDCASGGVRNVKGVRVTSPVPSGIPTASWSGRSSRRATSRPATSNLSHSQRNPTERATRKLTGGGVAQWQSD